MSGISFVICCHNSAHILPRALESIRQQIFPQNTSWEVLVIDNASTDDTAAVAARCWRKVGEKGGDFRIVREERLGVGVARYRGIKEARFEYICYVDDDNRLDKEFSIRALHVMEENPKIAACGSTSVGEFEVEPPPWFARHRRSFAVGDQANSPGDVTWTRGILWTAGMVLRKSAIQGLLDLGFHPMVTGAQGSDSLLRSEDSELCLALRLAGWTLWYEPELKVMHYMPKERLQWSYLQRLLAGVGYSHAFLLPYLLVTERKQDSLNRLWWEEVRIAAWNVIRKPRKLINTHLQILEGDPDSLLVKRSIGLLRSLLKNRKVFKAMIRDLRTAKWVEPKYLHGQKDAGNLVDGNPA